MIINVKADQITVPNSVGAGSSFSEAAVVRLANPSDTDRVITVSSVNTNAGFSDRFSGICKMYSLDRLSQLNINGVIHVLSSIVANGL